MSTEHSRVWFSPHGTEWEAETYEEALEKERDSLIEQLEAATQTWLYESRKRAEAEAERDGLLEQLETLRAAALKLRDADDAWVFANRGREEGFYDAVEGVIASLGRCAAHNQESKP